MKTEGIQGLLVETHNWGKTVAFWRELGFELEKETENHWGLLRHPGSGPYVFVTERPEGHPLAIVPILGVPDAAGFLPPSAGSVRRPFEAQHWSALEMLLADPDAREVSVQAPMPEGEAPAGHG